MREGDFKIFYTPVVYNPETGSSEPIQNGGSASNHLGSYGFNPVGAYKDRSDLKPTMSEPTHHMPLITIDPMTIPLATSATLIVNDGGDQGDDDRQGNLLRIIPNDGLHVEPYRDARNRSIYGSPENRVVTVENLHAAFVDCDGQRLDKIFDPNVPFKTTSIATCENLNGLVEKITRTVLNLVDLQLAQFRQEIDSKFDGSGATREIMPGAQDVPYTPPDSGQFQTITYTYRDDVEGIGEHEYKSTPRLLSQQLTPGTVYAIDMYTTSGDNKTYLGTLYKIAEAPHAWNWPNVKLTELSHETRQHYSYDLPKRHFVLRTLKQGESAVVTP